MRSATIGPGPISTTPAGSPPEIGVGSETDGQTPFVSTRIADSVAEFSGTQGVSNWFYGYWNKGTDSDGFYGDTEFVPFPNAVGPFGAANFWDGAALELVQRQSPLHAIDRRRRQPERKQRNSRRADHAAVRRYVSEVSGPVTISGRLAHTNTSGGNEWVQVISTGVCANSLLYIYFTAPGDGYIDDLKLVAGSVGRGRAETLSRTEILNRRSRARGPSRPIMRPRRSRLR